MIFKQREIQGHPNLMLSSFKAPKSVGDLMPLGIFGILDA
jgi:hypothetical protein